MRTRLPRLTAVGLAAFTVAGVATGARHSNTFGLKAPLDARQEVPPQTVKVRAARGTFTGTLTVTASRTTVAWSLTFSHLSGRALGADIHRGALGKSGPIAVRLCRPCRSGTRGKATLAAKAIRAIKTGRAYVNVATRKNPNGEIRGQIRLIQGY